MSFLDGLENTLKNMESREERDPAKAAEVRRARESDRAWALAAAPFADQLKHGPFTASLMDHATRIGFSQRTKVQMVWLNTTLRLQAKEKRLELMPTPEGVVATFTEGDQQTGRRLLDLNSDAEALAKEWLAA
jgi:hypothetical protein